MKKRLLGVTVFAILSVVIGLADFFGAYSISILFGSTWLDIEAISSAIQVGLVLQGIVLLVLAYGFLTGRGWAWILGVIFVISDLIFGSVGLPAGVIRIAYAVILLYYLMRPSVRAFFSKVPSAAPM